MTAGRPTKYKSEYCELLIQHMAEGMSYEAFAGHPDVAVSKQTIYDWEKEHPDFLDAKKKGFQLCQYAWEQAGAIRALKDKDFSWVGWYMNMKNRFRWRDKVETSRDPESSPDKLIITFDKDEDNK